jgi:CheY-like chemotaxis protein
VSIPVLIVADDTTTREPLARALRRAGHATVEATDACRALWCLERTPVPRLVLLDVMLPHMSAWHCLRARQQNAALASAPVVLLAESGLLGPGELAAVGAGGLLEKPVDRQELLATVAQYV